jgi:2-succinyl-5-enolpyruvyl-6-hydroxy-3-cyclohexene-1-carboxylate synthase
LDAERIAALYGLDYGAAVQVEELEAGLGRPGARLLHVRTDRAENVALHRRVWAAVEDALSPRGRAAAPGA